MPIHDGPTATSSATAIGSPHPVTADSGGRRPPGTSADRPTRRTVHPGPPGVAHPGEIGRPSPDGFSQSGPLFSADGTEKAAAGRSARPSDRSGSPSAMLTLRHRPPGDARRGAGAPSAGPTSSTPTGMAPKWGRTEIIPVRPAPDTDARIATKAAFSQVGGVLSTREAIFIWSPAAGPPPANSSAQRCLAALGTDTKGETAADHRRPGLKGASMSTTHPHRTLPAPPARLHSAPREQPPAHGAEPAASTPGPNRAHRSPPGAPRPSSEHSRPPGPATTCHNESRRLRDRPQPQPPPPSTGAKTQPPRDPMRSNQAHPPHPPQPPTTRNAGGPGGRPPGRHHARPRQAPKGGAA
ncbi:hypothetical protein FF36_00767 [Frankia torreyi]|uniref:Uncharacterized protein n=1 Tax=Frankia torreyi TaxID=1856 RepID=A0A0D8BKZ6_9ACTN|nr:hypothetical protein FF36_00767 [Frankia torreyi]